MLFGDIVEMIIVRRESKAKYIEFVVFKNSIVKEMDVFDFVDSGNEFVIAFGDVVAVFAKAGFEIGRLSIKIVVAEAKTDGRDFAEAMKPGGNTAEFVRIIDGFEGIDEVARNSNDLRFFLFGLSGELIEAVCSTVAKMNVTDGENFVFFLMRFIEAIMHVVKVFHQL